MLSKYFWSSKRAVFGEGRAILDVNIMVHYGAAEVDGYKRTPEDWQREEAEFRKHIEGRVITHLPEGQFVTIEREVG